MIDKIHFLIKILKHINESFEQLCQTLKLTDLKGTLKYLKSFKSYYDIY